MSLVVCSRTPQGEVLLYGKHILNERHQHKFLKTRGERQEYEMKSRLSYQSAELSYHATPYGPRATIVPTEKLTPLHSHFRRSFIAD